MRTSKGLLARAAALVVLVVAFVILLATGWLGAGVRVGLYASGLYRDGGSPHVDPEVFHDPDSMSTAVPAAPSAPVLPPASPAPGSGADAVAERIRALGPIEGDTFGMVVDGATTETLYADRAEDSATPASTLKVLTSLAALEI
ncbi:MAG: D-alanyl-D-alanine carboxypeptidase, partial [Propionibacteriaceae bacterium]|nr:D-alanyl-D-alanine carboxypeptidase [Propionibacteriaceae bacterium]